MTKSISSSKAASVCLAPGDAVNHIDHLAVIAYIMDIPIVTDEEHLVEVIKKYYPQVKPIYIEHHAKILEFLAENFDVLFVSGANYRADLAPLLELIFRKNIQFWYCPHGNSDKTLKHFKDQTMSLIYGPQMQERLEAEQMLERLNAYVRTSNYRFPFYFKYEQYYDDLVEREVFSHFKKKQKTILYAPTWQDLELSSSLFEAGLPVAQQLPENYNLIIKLHPWLEHHQPSHVNNIREKYHGVGNIVVLSLYPLVLPILKRSDIYLGDFSSVGYDYLYYNRPMFFFGTKEWTGSDRAKSRTLQECGVFIPDSAYENIYPFIENHLDQNHFRETREKLYEYTFGEERDFAELKEELDKMTLKIRNNPTGELR